VINGCPPYGCDPLDFVGVGVVLGAGAGGEDGFDSVGEGFGGDDVCWTVGCELEVPLLGAAAGWELDADAAGCVELRAADGEALPDGDPLEVGVPLAVGLVPGVVPATLCAAVLANRVVIPKAATTLSNVARHVRRERRRSPVSR